jgi:hypothetical protein
MVQAIIQELQNPLLVMPSAHSSLGCAFQPVMLEGFKQQSFLEVRTHSKKASTGLCLFI